jgi:hypothetical protein
MLKKSGIQILLESIFELNGRLFPDHFVREFNGQARMQFDFALTRQIHIDNSIRIESNVEFLMSPKPNRVVLLNVLADNAPNGQVVDVHLIPVVVFDRVREQFVLLFG